MRHLWALGGVVLVLVLAGSPRAAAADSTARIRVVHAAPDTAPVNVTIDGRVVLSDVQFPSISGYIEVPAGAHTVALAPKASTDAAAQITTEANFEAGAAYTVAAIGLANVSAEVYRDDLSAPEAGKAHVRIIHTSPDAPGADIELVDGPTLVQNLAFTEASPYLPIAAGTYDLRLVIAGDNTVVVPLPDTTVEAGIIYDVIATGRLANIQVIVGTFTPSAAAADVRALMPSAGASSPDWLLVLGLLALASGLIVQGGAAVHQRRRSD